MDAETIKAVDSIVADSNRRVRRDLECDRRAAKAGLCGGRVGRTGRVALRVGQAAYMRALATEGMAAVKSDEYWNDNARRYPHLRNDVYDGRRHGRATQVFKNGKWMTKNENGEWVAQDPPRRDWSQEGAPQILQGMVN